MLHLRINILLYGTQKGTTQAPGVGHLITIQSLGMAESSQVTPPPMGGAEILPGHIRMYD